MCNLIYSFCKSDQEEHISSFGLPLFPKLTQQDIAEADRLRDAYRIIAHSQSSNVKQVCKTLNVPERLGSGDLVFHINGAPIYVRDSRKKPTLNMKRPLVEGLYRKGRKGMGDNEDLVPHVLARLCDHRFVHDAVVNVFANMLNLREVEKRKNDPKYNPVHMSNTYLIDRLCFLKPYRKGTGQTDWSKVKFTYNPTGADCFTNATRKCPKTNKSNIGGMNLFECRLLIFPVNEYDTHFVFFCIEPLTLRQKFYDSFHGKVKNDKLRTHVSKQIHQWIKHQHQLRHNKPHPKSSLEWSYRLVQDKSEVLKNSHQGGTVDCGLHICLVPLLIADNQPLNIFGETKDEKVMAGIEMRRRMILSFQRNKCMFETRDNKPTLKDLQDTVAKVVESNKRDD